MYHVSSQGWVSVGRASSFAMFIGMVTPQSTERFWHDLCKGLSHFTSTWKVSLDTDDDGRRKVVSHHMEEFWQSCDYLPAVRHRARKRERMKTIIGSQIDHHSLLSLSCHRKCSPVAECDGRNHKKSCQAELRKRLDAIFRWGMRWIHMCKQFVASV